MSSENINSALWWIGGKAGVEETAELVQIKGDRVAVCVCVKQR